MTEPKQKIRPDTLREMTDGELLGTLNEQRVELSRLRPWIEMKLPPSTAHGGLGANSALHSNLRKNIARCLTELRMRQIVREFAPRIHHVLKGEGYGLMARQIRGRLEQDIDTITLGLVCGRMDGVVRVNANNPSAEARWRLKG